MFEINRNIVGTNLTSEKCSDITKFHQIDVAGVKQSERYTNLVMKEINGCL